MDNNQFSEEEIKKIGKQYLDFFRPIVSKISGEKLPKKLNKNELNDLGNFLNWLTKMGQIKSQIDSQTLPRDFKTKQQMQLMDNVFANLLGVDTENPAKLMIEQGDSKELYVSLLKSETKGQEFQKNIHDVYYKIGKLDRMTQLEEFQQSLGIDTFISHTQSAERINKNAKYLLRDRKRFSKRITERHVDIFRGLRLP